MAVDVFDTGPDKFLVPNDDVCLCGHEQWEHQGGIRSCGWSAAGDFCLCPFYEEDTNEGTETE